MVGNLYLVRHGETEGSEARRYKGSLDVPLSENGVEQMKRTAGFIRSVLDGRPLSAVFCSDLIRAKKSAELIALPHGLAPTVLDALRERNFGEWEGLSFDEIRRKFPGAFEAWAGDPLTYSPVGGESTLEVRDRVVGALEEILARHDGGDIAVVAHGGVNRVALCHLMGVPLENIFRVEQDFACVNIIEFHNGFPVVRLLNGGAFD